MNKTDINDASVTNTNTMLTINELSYTLDSLNKNIKTDIKSFTDNPSARINFPSAKVFSKSKIKKLTGVATTKILVVGLALFCKANPWVLKICVFN